MKPVSIIALAFLTALNYSTFCNAQTEYFSAENIFRFAEYLFEEGDYLRATGEYDRYLFTNNATLPDDEILYKIGECYQLAAMNERSRNYYLRIINDYPQSALYEKSHYQIAYSLTADSAYSAAIEYMEQNLRNIKSDETNLKMNQLLGFDYLHERQWHTAHNQFTAIKDMTANSSLDSLTLFLDTVAVRGIQNTYKSKFIAGLMSTVIPGTGKMYGGRFMDGINSLLLIGLTGWQSYNGFHDNGSKSAKGWIFGVASSVFYIGNIYGSVINIGIYNDKMDTDVIHSMNNIDLSWR